MIKKFKEYNEGFFYNTKIKLLCKKYNIKNYSINPDLSIDVEGSVDLYNLKLSSLPLRFSIVGGSFDCHSNHLTTLEGSPIEVGKDFSCYSNRLTTLNGCPREVGKDFFCFSNHLTTLNGCPREVGGDFYCYGNPVGEILNKFPEDLKKVSKVWDDFDIVRNGNELSAYRFKEMYFDLTGEEFKGDLAFKGYKVVE